MVYKLQSTHPKQNQKQILHESNKWSCFKLEEKATRSVKKKKNNFISVVEDKFVMSIRWGILTILCCKKLFSCINYLQFLK